MIPKDSKFVVLDSVGEYEGLYVAREDFEPNVIVAQFHRDDSDDSHFGAWLLKRGLAAQVACPHIRV